MMRRLIAPSPCSFFTFALPPTGTSETFYGFNAQGNNNVDFYKQNADGNGYTLANKVTSAAGTFYISDKYTGYRAAQYRVNGGEWIDLGDKNPATGYYASVSGWSSLEIRFDPARYGILYEDGVYVSGGGNPIAVISAIVAGGSLAGFSPMSTCGAQTINTQIVNSQVADELLTIKGIEASFVAGQDQNGETVVSARSLGTINVQRIMEQFGGGGHLNTAGARVDMTPEEILAKIEEFFKTSQ